jgi:hypothetical protein
MQMQLTGKKEIIEADLVFLGDGICTSGAGRTYQIIQS